MFHESMVPLLEIGNAFILIVMLIVLILIFLLFFGRTKRRVVSNYLSETGSTTAPTPDP